MTPVLGQRGRRRHTVPPPGGSGALSLRPTCGLSSGRVPLRVTRSPATRAPCGLLAPSPVRRAPPATATAPTAPAAGRGPTHRPGGSAGRWTTQKSWWPIPPPPEPLPSSGRRAPGLGGAAAPRQRPVGPRARGRAASSGWVAAEATAPAPVTELPECSRGRTPAPGPGSSVRTLGSRSPGHSSEGGTEGLPGARARPASSAGQGLGAHRAGGHLTDSFLFAAFPTPEDDRRPGRCCRTQGLHLGRDADGLL